MREPTNDEQHWMIIGGFETLQEYLEWMNEEEDPEVQAKLDEGRMEYEEFLTWLEEGEEPDDDELDGEETEFMPI